MASAKLDVEISGFKSKMKQAELTVKTYSAAIQSTEASLKAGANAEQMMAQKAQQLTAQIAAQKQVVENAQQALDKMAQNGQQGTAAYQQMQIKMLNATAALTDMQSELNGIKTGATGASKETDKLGKSVESIDKKQSLQSVISGIDGITGAAASAVKKIADIGKAIWNAGVDSTYWADDLATRAEKYEMDTTTLQQWEYAAKFVDTEVTDIIGARKKLISAMRGAENGVISIWGDGTGVETAGKSIDDVFWQTIQAMSQMTNATDRDMKAQELFGRSFDSLIPLINKGRKAWEGYMEEAPFLDEESVNNLTSANDAIERMNSEFENMKLQLFADLAPSIQTIADSLSTVFSSINEWAQSEKGQAAIQSLGDAISNIITGFTDNDFSGLVETAKGAIEGLTGAFQWFADNDIASIITGIAGAIGGLKLTGDALRFVQVLEGAKGLLNGGGGSPTGEVPVSPTTGSKPHSVLRKGITYAGKILPFALPVAFGIDSLVSEFNDQAVGAQVLSEREARRTAQELAGYQNDSKLGEYWQEFNESMFSPDSGSSIFYKMMQGMEDITYGKDNAWFEDLYNNLSDSATNMLDSMFEQYEGNETRWNSDAQGKLDFVSQIYEEMNKQIGDGIHVPTELDPNLQGMQEQLTNAGFTAPVTGYVTVSGTPEANGIAYVPFDGFPSILHKGERVLTARENRSYTANSNLYVDHMYMNNGMDADALAASMAAQSQRTRAGFGS